MNDIRENTDRLIKERKDRLKKESDEAKEKVNRWYELFPIRYKLDRPIKIKYGSWYNRHKKYLCPKCDKQLNSFSFEHNDAIFGLGDVDYLYCECGYEYPLDY